MEGWLQQMQPAPEERDTSINARVHAERSYPFIEDAPSCILVELPRLEHRAHRRIVALFYHCARFAPNFLFPLRLQYLKKPQQAGQIFVSHCIARPNPVLASPRALRRRLAGDARVFLV